MKRVLVSICTVAVILAAVPVFAAVQAGGKNDCLLYGKNCPNVVDSLPERITRLKAEIGKGEKVYTLEELKLLGRKLKEDNQLMKILNKPGKK